ncbi:MAG: crossover junction endodeoxyribonuclease RuvC [Caulobacterales bacterium]|nr:crossover junction endodeoxyribonuclease RuvC [Caulobacterales bacterium]
MRVLGIDPGLRRCGWGVVEQAGARLRHVACGVVTSDASRSLAERLATLYDALEGVLTAHRPDAAAVEETFVNANGASTLKLGQARAVALLAPARAGLPVAEYAPRAIKKAVTGSGAADKDQIATMIRVLLPGATAKADAADALAVAVCHAHHAQSARSLAISA